MRTSFAVAVAVVGMAGRVVQAVVADMKAKAAERAAKRSPENVEAEIKALRAREHADELVNDESDHCGFNRPIHQAKVKQPLESTLQIRTHDQLLDCRDRTVTVAHSDEDGRGKRLAMERRIASSMKS